MKVGQQFEKLVNLVNIQKRKNKNSCMKHIAGKRMGNKNKKSFSLQTVSNQQQLMSKIEEEESSYYQKNQLNIAFIADNQKDIQSMSIAESSGQSASSISRVFSNTNSLPSPSPFPIFQHEISSMDEWSLDSSDFFRKKITNINNYTRRNNKNSISHPIQEMNEDEKELQRINKGLKRRIEKKNKIITIHTSSLNQYKLRSKVRSSCNSPHSSIINQNDSGEEELREMIEEIEGKKNVIKNQ